MFDTLTVQLNLLAESSLQTPALAFPVYILAGMTGSLFPCVYPLIPITVAFLQKRRSENQPLWLHPLVYWAGTVIAYALLGFVAAIGGGAFNTMMQNGAVITATGFLFLFLTFAMIDWHPVQFTGASKISDRARHRAGLPFTGLMGFGAGFVASACVAPALVTMLIFIAKASAASSQPVLTVLYGGSLSAAFGAGLGVPFFLAGVFGARLPRSGGWMNGFKWAFAIIILGAAVLQLDKGFSVMGFESMERTLILGGLGLIALAAILGLKPPAKEDRPALTRFIFALFALVLGASTLFRGINPPSSGSSVGLTGQNPVPAYSGDFTSETVPKETIAGIVFYRDNDYAIHLAKKTGKPVFIDFYADWCTNCKDFYKLLEATPDLQQALGNAVVLKIKDTDPFFIPYQDDMDRYAELSIGLPFFVILSPEGKLLWKTTNYRDTAGMIENLK